jgi:hypothetical protein
VSRTDGIVVQSILGGDMQGYNDSNETVSREEAERSVGVIEALYSRMA